jgi:superfamily II DNA or RNA helicase
MPEFQPRDWQDYCLRAYQTDLKKNYLVEACIAAGKTGLALYMFTALKDTLDWRFLVVVVPAEHLMRQYAKDAKSLFDMELHYSGTDKRLSRLPKSEELIKSGYHGIIISYQWLTNLKNAQSLATDLGKTLKGKVFLVLDEVHHASSELSYGNACQMAFPDDIVARRLMTSGTPFRSDNNRILGDWLNYQQTDEKNQLECVPDFRYTLANALKDRIIPLFSFVTMQGEFSYRRDSYVFEGQTFTNAVDEQQLTDALNTAIDVNGDWLKEAILWAHQRMHNDRKKGIPECATYVRAKNIEAAGKIAVRIRQLTGEEPVVVVSKYDEESFKPRGKQDSSQLIEEFAAETGVGARSWIIGVGMLGEGVSIHRLKYRIHATNIRTPLSFIQDLGRLLRLFPQDPPEPVETLIPAHPTLVDLAINVMNEVAHIIKEREEEVKEDKNSSEGIGTGELKSYDFMPISSTGEIGSHIVDSEEIETDYTKVAEWAITNKPLFGNWDKTPAHFAQMLREDKSMYSLLKQEYSGSHGNRSKQRDSEASPSVTITKIPKEFPTEYVDMLANEKTEFASKLVNKKVYRLAKILYPSCDEKELQEKVKEIHNTSKKATKTPLRGFINYEAWEKVYEWVCKKIDEAQTKKGVEK